MSVSEERDDPVVEGLLAAPPLGVDVDRGWSRFRAASPGAVRRPFSLRAVQALAAAAAIVLVASTLSLTGVADSLRQIFEPRTFVAVTMDPRDFAALPDLSSYGTMTWSGTPSPVHVADLAAAAAQAGFTPARPATLPAGTTGDPSVTVIQRTSGTFTFDAAAARNAAAKVGRTPPPMPAGIDGAVVRGVSGPAVVQMYGSPKMPTLIVVQGRVPSLSSDASIADLRTFLLAQPGISPQLAAQLRAITDPAGTVPVPVPAGQTSKTVRVQGVEGLFVGDSTGLGAGVVWRQGDFLYALGGSLTESQVLAAANSLH